MIEEAAAIELRHVDKRYGAGPSATEVVSDCSLRIERGKLTVMIGPSGVGKSTLLRLIAGFERASAGVILADGKPVTGPGRDRQVMFQETALFPWMTTQDNVVYGPQARGEYTSAARELAERLLAKVGLGAFRRRYPTQLSGGMQRRAELARALINQPAVMILDEPFRGLDAMTRKLMLEYYAALRQESQGTCLFVTTDVDEALFLADRLLVMSHLPTQVRAVIDVELPAPRGIAVRAGDDAARALKLRVLSLLHEEAMISFSRGGGAAADFIAAYGRRLAAPSL